MDLTFTESSPLLLSVLDLEPARVSPPELALNPPSVGGLSDKPESGDR